MKKLVCLLIVLVLCLTMAAPVFATENGFVPSITYKPNPEIVLVENEDGEECIGIIRDQEGNILDYVDHGCLMSTPIAHVWDEEIEVPEEVEKLLIKVYDGLNDGSMELPYEKHEDDLDALNMVILDLFDARWICEEHREMIEKEGVTFEITFDVGIAPDVPIYAMTYDEEANEWSPIEKVVNNGDGTVTCTFEHLCAVAFSIPMDVASAPSVDVQSPSVLPWIIVLILAVVGLVVILVAKNKKKTAA